MAWSRPSARLLGCLPLSLESNARLQCTTGTTRFRIWTKYRTEAAERYHAAIEMLASAKADTVFPDSIIPGDFVMRSVSNRQMTLHSEWDGRFVVDLTSKDTYRLPTGNGYTLPKFGTLPAFGIWTRTNERAKHTGDLCEASHRQGTIRQACEKSFRRSPSISLYEP